MADNRNPANPIVKTVKKLTTNVGNVKGLHGNVFDPESSGISTGRNTFIFTRILSREIPSLAQSYDLMKRQDVQFDTIAVDNDGTVDLSSISDSDEDSVLCLIAGVEVPRATRFNLKLQAKNAVMVGYLNGTKIFDGQESITANPFLQPSERHTLQIFIRRLKRSGTVAKYFQGRLDVSQSIPFVIGPPKPDVPEWSDTDLIYSRVGNDLTQDALILSWEDSPFVGGWHVERSNYERLGVVAAVVPSGTNAMVFVVSGVHAPKNNLNIEGTHVGEVISFEVDSALTRIAVIAKQSETVSFEGKYAFSESDTFSLAELDRQYVRTDDTVVFRDESVAEGQVYGYRLSAWSIFNPNVISDLSPDRTGYSLDLEPPGPIELYPDDLTATSFEDGVVTVNHIYPPDDDLLGYRLYVASGGNYRLLSDVRKGNPFLLLDNVTYDDGDEEEGEETTPERFGIFKFIPERITGFDAEYVASGYVATTYDYAGNELSIPSGTFIPFTLLVGPPENFTAFDNVISPSNRERRPPEIPEVLWEAALARRGLPTGGGLD